MARYMVLWEVDASRISDDAKARKAQFLAGQELVMQKIKEGVIKEWGAFAGELSGYSIMEGSAKDLHALNALWLPLVKFTTKEALTIEVVNKLTKAMPE